MILVATNSSRPKACQKLAGGKAASSRRSAAKAGPPRSASHFIAELKGRSAGLMVNTLVLGSKMARQIKAKQGQTSLNKAKQDKKNIFATTIFPQLRRSEIFLETQPSQNPKLRRSGISSGDEYVAPTELTNYRDGHTTNIPLLRNFAPLPLGVLALNHVIMSNAQLKIYLSRECGQGLDS